MAQRVFYLSFGSSHYQCLKLPSVCRAHSWPLTETTAQQDTTMIGNTTTGLSSHTGLEEKLAVSVLYLLHFGSSLLLKCGTAHMLSLHTTGLRLPKNLPAVSGQTIALTVAGVCAVAQLLAVLSLLAWLHRSLLTPSQLNGCYM